MYYKQQSKQWPPQRDQAGGGNSQVGNYSQVDFIIIETKVELQVKCIGPAVSWQAIEDCGGPNRGEGLTLNYS